MLVYLGRYLSWIVCVEGVENVDDAIGSVGRVVEVEVLCTKVAGFNSSYLINNR